MTDKTRAMEAVRALSEHATLTEIVETLSILAAIRRGQDDVKAGRVIPHDEVEARLESWISRSAGLVRQ